MQFCDINKKGGYGALEDQSLYMLFKLASITWEIRVL